MHYTKNYIIKYKGSIKSISPYKFINFDNFNSKSFIRNIKDLLEDENSRIVTISVIKRDPITYKCDTFKSLCKLIKDYSKDNYLNLIEEEKIPKLEDILDLEKLHLYAFVEVNIEQIIEEINTIGIYNDTENLSDLKYLAYQIAECADQNILMCFGAHYIRSVGSNIKNFIPNF